jgi:PIN domain nuclease of toxin-antitoxin system
LRFLLDTQALLWWFSDDQALPASCRELIAQSDSEVIVSAASAWEISTKFRLGRLPTAGALVQDFGGYMNRDRFHSLSVSSDHGLRAGQLPGPLQDPFDRMIIAQAEIEKLSIMSNEKIFEQYGAHRIW